MKKLFKSLTLLALVVTTVSCGNSKKEQFIGEEWALISMEKTNGDQIMITTNNPTLIFADSSRLNGFGGCNGFFGDYTVKDNNLTIDLKGRTQAMCPDIENEDNLITILGGVTNYDIVDEQLVLYDKNNKELARFERKAKQN